ncbi:hypothetical protein [Nocardiopsis synnemataformans]|uniref:hypothetical protein n=1 Tax=Nocardiopsis synnemataformans TaxID=61305 RepID=UPI003EBDEB1E
MTVEETSQPDPDAEYWTINDIAAYWGIKPQTVRWYRARPNGYLPPQDDYFGRTPVWKPKTVIDFQRAGQGKRTDLEDEGSDKPRKT